MKLEILLFSAFWLLIFAIIWHTAKYGFIRTLLPYRYNAKLYRAMFIGLLLFFIFAISGADGAGIFDKPEMRIVWQILIIAAIVFFFVARFLILEPGKSEYERARVDLLYIKDNYFIHGVCSGKGIELEDSEIAQESLNLFNRAIFRAKKKMRKSSSLAIREDLALAYIGKGSLLRLMLKLGKAKKYFEESLVIVKNLLRDDPENLKYWALKSCILFQYGELAECQGYKDEALILYKESFWIDVDYGINLKDGKEKEWRIRNLNIAAGF